MWGCTTRVTSHPRYLQMRQARTSSLVSLQERPAQRIVVVSFVHARCASLCLHCQLDRCFAVRFGGSPAMRDLEAFLSWRRECWVRALSAAPPPFMLAAHFSCAEGVQRTPWRLEAAWLGRC